MKDLSQLPELEQLFSDLRLGKHICAEDGSTYYLLRDHFEDYARLFSALGFELRSHERGFFYFHAGGDLGKEATQMAVFFFVLVDALGNEGANVRDAIFEQDHRIDELPHFKLESHRQCLAEVDVNDPDDLDKVIGRLERYGFVETSNRGTFGFRSPAWRFVDLCYEAASDEAAEPDEHDDDELDEVS